MQHWDTFSEETEAATARSRARLLTVVLRYDNLLASEELSTTLLLTGEVPLEIGRAQNPLLPVVTPQRLELLDRWASLRHVRIERRGDSDVLLDVGSRNGTFINGARAAEQELFDGDMIEIGHTLLRYRAVEPRLAAAVLSSSGNGGSAGHGSGGNRPLMFGPTRTLCPEVATLAIELLRIAPALEPVLILGETGVGKEIAASTIHKLSGRSGSLRPLDCGAIPENLFESVLFGHRRGAFTGAIENRTGEIVAARGGTLFLDEIGNLPPASQAKLLRALEAGQITPVGAGTVEPVDVRWIAATNRDLLVDPGDFRPDLLRRLAGYVARLPPLRARREDLGVLSAYFLQQAGVTKAGISVAAARRLFLAPLLGNLRQLRTALRSAVTLAGGQPIDLHHLPPLDEPPPRRAGASSTSLVPVFSPSALPASTVSISPNPAASSAPLVAPVAPPTAPSGPLPVPALGPPPAAAGTTSSPSGPALGPVDSRAAGGPERPAERPAERSAERPAERPADRSPDRAADRSAERPTENPAERSAEHLVEGSAERSAEHAPDRSAETPSNDSGPLPLRPPRRPSAEELRESLRTTGGNVVHVAQRFGVHARQVYRWLHRYQIPLTEFRRSALPD